MNSKLNGQECLEEVWDRMGGSYVMGNLHRRTKGPREKPWAHPEAHHAIMFVDAPLLGGFKGGCVQMEMVA